jgi:hypothetical protein
MMMGLHCISDDQLKRKDAYQEEYGKLCKVLLPFSSKLCADGFGEIE